MAGRSGRPRPAGPSLRADAARPRGRARPNLVDWINPRLGSGEVRRVMGGAGQGRRGLHPRPARTSSSTLDQESGAVLWEINLGSPVTGNPISFAAGDRQYVGGSTGSAAQASTQLGMTPELGRSAGNNVLVYTLPLPAPPGRAVWGLAVGDAGCHGVSGNTAKPSRRRARFSARRGPGTGTRTRCLLPVCDVIPCSTARRAWTAPRRSVARIQALAGGRLDPARRWGQARKGFVCAKPERNREDGPGVAEDPFSAQIGNRVTLTGHFDVPVVLDDGRPLGANGSAGFECRVRLPDGTIEEAVISPDEAAAILGAETGAQEEAPRPADASRPRLPHPRRRSSGRPAHPRRPAATLSSPRESRRPSRRS